MLRRNRSVGISTVVIAVTPRLRDGPEPAGRGSGTGAPGAGAPASDQRNGGEKISPPSFHWALRPRAMLAAVPSPMLAAKISP